MRSLVLTRRAAALCLSLLFGLSAARSAHAEADPRVEQAKVQFSAGAQAYSAGRYDAAVLAFEESYRLAQRPQLLFNLAQAERKSYFAGGKKEPQMLLRAIAHYEQYVKETKEGARVPDAVDALSELGPLAAKLDPQTSAGPTPAPASTVARLTVVSQVEGSKVAIDDGAPLDAPFIGDVTPGKHRVRVLAEGYVDATRELATEAGGRTTLDVPLEEKPAELVVDVARACDVYVDGKPVGSAPSARPFQVHAGSHVVSLVSTGRKIASQDVVLVRGKRKTVTAELVRSGQRTASGVFLGVGGATVAAGLATGVVSLLAESSARKTRDASGNISAQDLADYQSASKRRDDYRTASIVTLSAGAAVLATGTFLFLFDKPELNGAPPEAEKPASPKKDVDLALGPMVSPGGGGLLLGGTF